MRKDTKQFIKALCVMEPTPGKVYPVLSMTFTFTLLLGGLSWSTLSLLKDDLTHTFLLLGAILAYNFIMHTGAYFFYRQLMQTALYRHRLYYLLFFSLSMFFPIALFTVTCLVVAEQSFGPIVWYGHGVATFMILALFVTDFIATQKQIFHAYLRRPIKINDIMFQGQNVKLVNIVGYILTPYASFLFYKGVLVDIAYNNLLATLILNLAAIIMLHTFLTSLYALKVVLPKAEKETGLPAIINTRIYK